MSAPGIPSADDQTFELVVLKAPLPVVVDFWGPTCPPCVVVSRLLAELAPAYAGRVQIVQVNAEDAIDVAARYHIRGLPTLVAFRDGKPLETRVGVQAKAKLKAWLDQLSV